MNVLLGVQGESRVPQQEEGILGLELRWLGKITEKTNSIRISFKEASSSAEICQNGMIQWFGPNIGGNLSQTERDGAEPINNDCSRSN